MGDVSSFNSVVVSILRIVSRLRGKMKYLTYLCFILATVEIASGLLHKLFKKEKEDCEIIWEEHQEPHCTTIYEPHCETKYSDKCHTEYTTECKPKYEQKCKTEYDTECKTENVKECSTEYVEKCTDEYTEECWDEWKDVCHNHPECQTTYEEHCEQLFKKHCYGGSKKGKKWRRDVAEELVNGEEDDEEFDELKKISTSELLDIVSESHESNDNDDFCSSKQKRHIHHKIAKLLKKGKGEETCEHIPAGEHCEKVPVEHCHDVEKCSKEIHRECKQVPHQKCWQEPQENCWQVPHEKCWDEPKEKCWDEPREKCWEEPSQVCTRVPHERCIKEPHEHCTDHPKEHCQNVVVKVAKKHCHKKNKKDKKGHKLIEKLFKKGKW